MNNQKLTVDQLLYFFFPHQAELQEVVGEGETEDDVTASFTSSATAESSQAESTTPEVQHMLPVLKLTLSSNICVKLSISSKRKGQTVLFYFPAEGLQH